MLGFTVFSERLRALTPSLSWDNALSRRMLDGF
jgi:hypothetical protein